MRQKGSGNSSPASGIKTTATSTCTEMKASCDENCSGSSCKLPTSPRTLPSVQALKRRTNPRLQKPSLTGTGFQNLKKKPWDGKYQKHRLVFPCETSFWAALPATSFYQGVLTLYPSFAFDTQPSLLRERISFNNKIVTLAMPKDPRCHSRRERRN